MRSSWQRPKGQEKQGARLGSEWTLFQEDCGSYEKSPRWRDALAGVDNSIDEAAMYVESGELPKAHELLEEVRDSFFRLREERSWEYYIDYLNRYHGTMEEVLREAGEEGSEGLDEAGKVRLYTLQGEARARWEALSAASFNPALFGFDREKTRELQKAVAAVGKSLDALRAAFCEKDSEAVIKAALGLRPPYVKAYLMFGDFGGLQ